jgi:hypothetical protein
MRISFALLSIASLICVATAYAEKQVKTPDATISYSGTTVAVGVGITFGNGKVNYRDQIIPISLKGINVLNAGVSKLEGSGEVYNLKRLSDLAGVYRAGQAGITVGNDGHSKLSLINAKGVSIQIYTKDKGANFALAPGGVKISIDQVEAANRLGDKDLAQKIKGSLPAIAGVCGCPLRVNVDWESYKSSNDRRHVAYTIDAFLMAMNKQCSNPSKAKALCSNYEQLDVSFNDDAVAGVVRNGTTVRATTGSTQHASADMFIELLTATH